MIADRFEIIDDGHLTIAIRHGANTLYIDELEDEFAVAAIRQQARDLEQLRTDLAAAVAARANMDTDRLEWMNRAEQAEARLAAIDAAPVVAWQWMGTGHFRKNKPDGALVFDWRPLIAKPAKD